MKKPSWIIIALLVLLFVAILTNPNLEEHKQAVKTVVNQKIQSSLSDNGANNFEALGTLLGGSLAGKLIDDAVTKDNYLLFSITKINWDGESRSIGYGVFGNVFLSQKVHDAFSDKPINNNDYSNDTYEEYSLDTIAVEAVDTGSVNY